MPPLAIPKFQVSPIPQNPLAAQEILANQAQMGARAVSSHLPVGSEHGLPQDLKAPCPPQIPAHLDVFCGEQGLIEPAHPLKGLA